MSKISVCGLVNMETTVSVEQFPLEYRPVDYRFFGINSFPGGVGFNVASAFKALGDDVTLFSLCGSDPAAEMIKSELESRGICSEYVLPRCRSTAQSVVLYDKSGRRNVICDLTDNQELTYDEEVFIKNAVDSDIICLCNINYSASMIPVAKRLGIMVATDVHCLCDIYDEYNSRFLRCADIVFLSNENIIGREYEFSQSLMREYGTKIVVVGMGDKGALLRIAESDEAILVPAVYTRPVVNTVGAGDSLYSAFLHFYADTHDALVSLKRAVYFASFKIGENGAAKGFLSHDDLLKIMGE